MEPFRVSMGVPMGEGFRVSTSMSFGSLSDLPTTVEAVIFMVRLQDYGEYSNRDCSDERS